MDTNTRKRATWRIVATPRVDRIITACIIVASLAIMGAGFAASTPAHPAPASAAR